jgi:hypothetical protein
MHETLVYVLLCHSLLDILAIRSGGLFSRNVRNFLQDDSRGKSDVSRNDEDPQMTAYRVEIVLVSRNRNDRDRAAAAMLQCI